MIPSNSFLHSVYISHTKADLDPAGDTSYRPISNLKVLSKLLERLVARQMLDQLVEGGLLPATQSAYNVLKV